MTKPLVEVRDLGVTYTLAKGELNAVSDVGLVLNRGEALGLVGESGCGKSTLARAMLRMLPNNAQLAEQSRILFDGNELTEMSDERFRREVRWKRIAMVFQSAMNSLNPVTTVGKQIVDLIRLHRAGVNSADARSLCRELLQSVSLPPEVADRFPHELSGGMRQRAIIAMSLVADPDVLVADEATTALDVVVQAQILAELADMRRERGLALLVVSHDMDVIAQVCDRVAVMYAGQIVETGPTSEVLANPAHPYTIGLLAALPRLHGPRRRLATLGGAPPELIGTALDECLFAPRCPIVAGQCTDRQPTLGEPSLGRQCRCYFPFDQRLRAERSVESS